MKKFVLTFVLVPVLVLALLTVLRAWLEVNSPDGAVTSLISVNALSMLWMLCAPALMMRRGLSLVQCLLAGLLFFVLHRMVIGAVYAMAWENKWKVAGTDEFVRYYTQTATENPDATTMQVFLGNTFLPVGFALVILLVIWAITWAVAFRGTRSFSGRPAQG